MSCNWSAIRLHTSLNSPASSLLCRVIFIFELVILWRGLLRVIDSHRHFFYTIQVDFRNIRWRVPVWIDLLLLASISSDDTSSLLFRCLTWRSVLLLSLKLNVFIIYESSRFTLGIFDEILSYWTIQAIHHNSTSCPVLADSAHSLMSNCTIFRRKGTLSTH